MANSKRPPTGVDVHPLTGVTLNRVFVRRKALEYHEAVTAIILRLQGIDYQVIAQMLGTNTARLGEVFRREKHPDAWGDAVRLLKA